MNNEELLLTNYLAAVRRRFPYVIAVLLGFLAAGIAYSYLQTPLYRASAEVLITPSQVESQLNITSGNGRNSDRDLNNEVKFANSDRVAAAAAATLGEVPTVSVRSEDDADTLVIAATATEPEVAAAAANAYAEAFLQERVAFAGESYASATAAIESRLDVIRSERDVLFDTFRGGVAPDQTTQSRINVLDNQETSLLNQLAQFELAIGLTDSGRVQLNREAVVPDAAFHPNWIRNIVGAVLLGLVGGVGVAMLAEALSDKVRSREELLAASGGITVLTGVPSSGRGKYPSLLSDTASVQFRESFRSLRTSLQVLQEPDSSLVLLVTSPNQGEGKSTIALNLATTFARAGQEVLLIDADLRRPQVHNLVQVHNEGGVAEFLRSGEAGVVREQVSGKNVLDVMPAGQADEELFERLATGGLTVLLDKVRDTYDIVVVDSAPILPVADTLAVAPVVDGVVLAVRSRSTTRRAVGRAVELLGRAEANVLGTVLTMSTDSATRYGYGGYGNTPDSK